LRQRVKRRRCASPADSRDDDLGARFRSKRPVLFEPGCRLLANRAVAARDQLDESAGRGDDPNMKLAAQKPAYLERFVQVGASPFLVRDIIVASQPASMGRDRFMIGKTGKDECRGPTIAQDRIKSELAYRQYHVGVS